MESTGFKDKNGTEIFVGNKVKFKFYGQHYFIEKVHKTKNGFYPFDPSIRVKSGLVSNHKTALSFFKFTANNEI